MKKYGIIADEQPLNGPRLTRLVTIPEPINDNHDVIIIDCPPSQGR